MTRTWLSNSDVDPEVVLVTTGERISCNSTEHYAPDSCWKTISYRRKPTEEQRRRRREKAALRAEIMSDPKKRYDYERKQNIRAAALRMMRDNRYYGWTYRQLCSYVDSCMPRNDEPMIITNPKLAKAAAKEASTDKIRRQPAGNRAATEVERRADEGDFTTKTFSADFIKQITDKRRSMTVDDGDGGKRPMTQKDLALLINRDAALIKAFEAGELLFDVKLKQQLNWKLGFP